MAVATPTHTAPGRAGVSKPRLKRSMGLWMATALVILLGIPVYVWLKWRQGKEPVADHPVPGPLLEASATARPRHFAAPQEEREVRTPIGLGLE